MAAQNLSPFDVLGLPSDATDSQIRAAYLQLARKHHPDKNDGTTCTQATADFARLASAYQTLIDPEQRKAAIESLKSLKIFTQ